MKETERLANELAELREAMRLLIAVTTTVLATTNDSAAATKSMAAALRSAELARPRSDTFWEFAAGVLKMLSSEALQQHPQDSELLGIHQGVRPSKPH